jgi:hypothetical protein
MPLRGWKRPLAALGLFLQGIEWLASAATALWPQILAAGLTFDSQPLELQ